jgi:hypothetical protein
MARERYGNGEFLEWLMQRGMAGAYEQYCDLFISEPAGIYISACLSEMLKNDS